MPESATVQGILARFLNTDTLDSQRRKVCAHLLACRTEALGGLRWQCDACGAEQPRYHGCRDRHCPQCQGRATRLWSERQQNHLLPVSYHHLVFTVPHRLNGWVQLHPQVLYRRLFQAAWATLKAFGQDPKRLGGELGMTAVLHTWGQNLSRHVHLHCLVPGGALSSAGQWKATKGNYLFPVRALSRRYLLHILPNGLMRIRHYGFLANRGRETKLACIRRALAQAEVKPANAEPLRHASEPDYPCTRCRQGRLRIIGHILPARFAPVAPFR